MGRGTTLIEAALLGRVPFGCDINPLSAVLTRPRLNPPTVRQIEERLREIRFDQPDEFPQDLLVFYHPETIRQIASLKKYLVQRREANSLDATDDWICLVALNRPHRAFTGFLLRLHHASESGGFGQIAAKDQRAPQTNTVAKKRAGDHSKKKPPTVG
jgi:hypothetical protein